MYSTLVHCTARKTVKSRKLLAQGTSTVRQDLKITGNYWLKEQALSGKIWKSPVITGSKNKQCQARSDNTRQLLDLRTSTIRQDLTIPGNYWLKEQVLSGKIWQYPAITGSKNKYCPERSDNTRQLLDLRTSTVRLDLTIPGNYWI